MIITFEKLCHLSQVFKLIFKMIESVYIAISNIKFYYNIHQKSMVINIYGISLSTCLFVYPFIHLTNIE